MDLPRFHRLRPAYYRLEGRRCRACGAVHFPSRQVCRRCAETDLEPHRLSPRGKVYSYTQMAQAASGFAAPHLMALVELDDGPVIAAQLTDVDADDIEIGMPVEMITRRLRETGPQGYLVYGYKFRPLLTGDPS